MENIMTTLQKLNLVIIISFLLVFPNSSMAWNWKNVEKGWKNVVEETEKGSQNLVKGVKKGYENVAEEVEKGIEKLEKKVPEWVQDLEKGLEAGGEKIEKIIQKIDLNFDKSGQGCGSGLSTQIVTDQWGIFDFTLACQLHDKCYCQRDVTQKSCDNDFLTNLQQACPSKESDPISYQICGVLAKVYWYSVSEAGQSAWKEAQKNVKCQ
jgi:hypothetical protein